MSNLSQLTRPLGRRSRGLSSRFYWVVLFSALLLIGLQALPHLHGQSTAEADAATSSAAAPAVDAPTPPSDIPASAIENPPAATADDSTAAPAEVAADLKPSEEATAEVAPSTDDPPKDAAEVDASTTPSTEAPAAPPESTSESLSLSVTEESPPLAWELNSSAASPLENAPDTAKESARVDTPASPPATEVTTSPEVRAAIPAAQSEPTKSEPTKSEPAQAERAPSEQAPTAEVNAVKSDHWSSMARVVTALAGVERKIPAPRAPSESTANADAETAAYPAAEEASPVAVPEDEEHGSARQAPAEPQQFNPAAAAVLSPDVLPPPSADPATLVLINPRDSGGTIRYLVDGEPQALRPGESQTLRPGASRIVFHRGGTFGNSEYVLRQGSYEFRPTTKGWTLNR